MWTSLYLKSIFICKQISGVMPGTTWLKNFLINLIKVICIYENQNEGDVVRWDASIYKIIWLTSEEVCIFDLVHLEDSLEVQYIHFKIGAHLKGFLQSRGFCWCGTLMMRCIYLAFNLMEATKWIAFEAFSHNLSWTYLNWLFFSNWPPTWKC